MTKAEGPEGRVLIIAGSDSGGGAGIQADIKTVTMLGGYAMTAVTAITVQDTKGVHGVWPVPVDAVIGQIQVTGRGDCRVPGRSGINGAARDRPGHGCDVGRPAG